MAEKEVKDDKKQVIWVNIFAVTIPDSVLVVFNVMNKWLYETYMSSNNYISQKLHVPKFKVPKITRLHSYLLTYHELFLLDLLEILKRRLSWNSLQYPKISSWFQGFIIIFNHCLIHFHNMRMGQTPIKSNYLFSREHITHFIEQRVPGIIGTRLFNYSW